VGLPASGRTLDARRVNEFWSLQVHGWRGDFAVETGTAMGSGCDGEQRKILVWWWRKGVPHEVFMRHWISCWGRLLDREAQPFDFCGIESRPVVVVADNDDGRFRVAKVLDIFQGGCVRRQIDDSEGDAGVVQGQAGELALLAPWLAVDRDVHCPHFTL